MSNSLCFGEIVQIAYAVSDVRAAAQSFASRLGAGPFFVRHHDLPRAVDHLGEPGEFDHSSAYGQWGPIQLELFEVHHAAPKSLAEVVMKSSGIHHMTWFVEAMETEQLRLIELGWPEVLHAETASGFRYAFHDARAQLGHLVEIYEPNDNVIRLYAKVATAARDWDGKAPVREL